MKWIPFLCCATSLFAKGPCTPERLLSCYEELLAAKQPFYGNPPESCPPPFRMFTMGDVLYWQASEANLEYAMKERASFAASPVPNATVMKIDFPWKSGFRLGGGIVLPYNDWQIEADWTRFYHCFRESHTFTFSDEPGLIALWMHPKNSASLSWKNGSFNWDLKFDTLDLDLLRVGFTNCNFSFAPLIGLKRVWIKQHFHVRYDNAYLVGTGELPFLFYDVSAGNDFRGVGPRIGFDSHLWARWGFNFFVQLSTAMAYGRFHLHRVDISNETPNIDVIENFHRFRPMAQASLGLEWSQCLSRACSRILFQIGYEAQYWWGQNQISTFVSKAMPISRIKTNGALTFKGLDFHARFDF